MQYDCEDSRNHALILVSWEACAAEQIAGVPTVVVQVVLSEAPLHGGGEGEQTIGCI